MVFSLFKKKDKPATPVITTAVADPPKPAAKTSSTTSTHPKQSGFKSKRGLIVGEVLLLDYVNQGKVPIADGKYQAFWEKEYSIYDVDRVLSGLMSSGFIEDGPASETLMSMKVNELKALMGELGMPADGKKADMIERAMTISDDKLKAHGVKGRPRLTEMGRIELEENYYIPYMHRYEEKTPTFNVWTVNAMFLGTPGPDWETRIKAEIVRESKAELRQIYAQEKAEKQEQKEREERMKAYPEAYNRIEVSEHVKMTHERFYVYREYRKALLNYRIDDDDERYIIALEKIWHQDLKYPESHEKHMVLVELYLKVGRIDDALSELDAIGKIRGMADRAERKRSAILG